MSALAESLVELADPGEAARQVAALNMRLASEPEITDEISHGVWEIVVSIGETDFNRWMQISQEHVTHALTAVIDAQRAVAEQEERYDGARDELRSALGRLSQALGLMAEDAIVSPDRSAKELSRWLVHTLDVPQRDVAETLDIPLRRFQRWVSETEQVEPEGVDADKLRLFAAIVNQLRFSLTGRGILRWFELPNGWLDEQAPKALLDDPLARPRLVSAAQSLRESGGS